MVKETTPVYDKFASPQKTTGRKRAESLEKTQTSAVKQATVNMAAAVTNAHEYQSYQTKKMYNASEAVSFGSAEIKLKQLQMKLRESETAKA